MLASARAGAPSGPSLVATYTPSEGTRMHKASRDDDYIRLLDSTATGTCPACAAIASRCGWRARQSPISANMVAAQMTELELRNKLRKISPSGCPDSSWAILIELPDLLDHRLTCGSGAARSDGACGSRSRPGDQRVLTAAAQAAPRRSCVAISGLRPRSLERVDPALEPSSFAGHELWVAESVRE